MASKKSSTKTRNTSNLLEKVREIGDPTGIAKGVGDSLINELAIKSGKQFFEDFLGMSTSSKDKNKSGDSQKEYQKEVINGSIDIVSFEKKTQKVEQRIEAAIDYHRDIVRSSEKVSKQELSTMNSQIQEILQELRSLIGTSRELSVEFGEITMEQAPAQFGVYHKNFFDWMLTMIRQAKQKVEDSAAWLNASKGKGAKKGYWGMFKKHGTSFALSNERGVATQVG